jgi:hypothetical protein
MTLVRRRVVNPSPSVLALVNPKKKRGRKMATRKRKRSSKRRVSAKRRNPVNPVNPTRRRRRSTKRSRVYARRRNPVNPVNPSRRRRRYARRRHRNPVTGVFGRAVPLVLGSAAIGIAAPFTAQLVGRFAPQLLGTPIGAAATTFGTGWGLSAIARMFSFTRRWADDVLLAGAVLAGGQLFSAYVAPMIRLGGGGNPTGMGARYRRPGMGGIGVMTGIPPGMAALPPMTNNQGMQGIGMRPGTYAN